MNTRVVQSKQRELTNLYKKKMVTDAEYEELCDQRSACLQRNRMILCKSSPSLQIKQNE